MGDFINYDIIMYLDISYLFLFFIIWVLRSRLFHSFRAESIVRWDENGIPNKNHLTTHKQNLASLTCDPSQARTHSSEMTRDLERLRLQGPPHLFHWHCSHFHTTFRKVDHERALCNRTLPIQMGLKHGQQNWEEMHSKNSPYSSTNFFFCHFILRNTHKPSRTDEGIWW